MKINYAQIRVITTPKYVIKHTTNVWLYKKKGTPLPL